MKARAAISILFLASCGSSSGTSDGPVAQTDAALDVPVRADDAASGVEATSAMVDTAGADIAQSISVDGAYQGRGTSGSLDASGGDGSRAEVGISGTLDGGTVRAVPTRVVLIAAPTTIIAAPYADTVIFGQLQDDAGNPVLTSVPPEAPLKISLASSNNAVLPPYYSAGDDRGFLMFEKSGSPNWAYTFFKATSIPGSATISGNGAGLTVVPVQVTTVAQGGAPASLRIFAQPSPVPSGGTRGWFPVIQIVDSAGAPTYRPFSFDVTITSDNPSVCAGGSLFFNSSFNYSIATISVPAALGSATLTASAAGLTPGTAVLTVVP